MNTATIEELAYLLRQAKDEGLPQPIVFLGAGASKTGGVPLANEIVSDILEKYKESPRVRALNNDSKTYTKLMACLTPFERNKLLKDYVNKAKINVTHIYLAQLLIEGFVDYVLTVNFDNLMLRALALFNSFPATYDMAILKDLTTTSFNKKSVVYLHGQHHGLWLLNTEEEMTKVNEIIPPILNSIKDQRPWIFIGYSGQDPIFDHIKKLGRFDNGLYWVTYYDNNPSPFVCNEILNKANTNAFLIKGFDADSFMLKLNTELDLPQPLIFDRPFTALNTTIENIVDIDDQEHFKGVKERLEIVKDEVGQAIMRFEKGKINVNKNLAKEIDIHSLKKQIIDKIITKKFDLEEIEQLEKSANQLNDEEINILMASMFNSWGAELYDSAKEKNSEELYEMSCQKYKKAAELNSKNDAVFSNWGVAILALAKIKADKKLYKLSFEKYKKATTLNPTKYSAYHNWGNAIFSLAKLQNDEELYRLSFEKYERATDLHPEASTYYNWATSIYNLAKLKKDGGLYVSSFDKFKKATDLNPKYYGAYNNWGNAISDLARLQNDEELYKLSFEKYEKAIRLNINDGAVYANWGTALVELAKIKKDKKLQREGLEKLNKSFELGGDSYNLACVHALGNRKKEALEILENALSKKEITVSFVEGDSDWISLKNDLDFNLLLKKYN